MSLISLDGSQFSDIDTLVIGALTLSAATGHPFEMDNVGKHASTPGVTPAHLTAMKAVASTCRAAMKGEAFQAKSIRFSPSRRPQALELVVDTGEATGRPSPAPVTPLIEALMLVLSLAESESFVRLRGANASPSHPSAFWVRETLAPMVRWTGIEMAVEIEKWGWHPEGGGETTLVVDSRTTDSESRSSLEWEERGDLVGLWALVALSPRLEGKIGDQMLLAAQRELARDQIQPVMLDFARVRSPGPGSGLFLAAQFEQVSAGFESISHRGMSAELVGQGAASAFTHYFWSDAAFEPELARAMMIPLALSGRPARFTTSELTLPMRVLEYLIPRFLPVQVTLEKHPTGGQVHIQPRPDEVST